MLTRIHHLAQAVPDLSSAESEYEEMGYTAFRRFRSNSTNADIVLMTHPREVGVELFQFADLDAPGVAAMRHHFAFESDDLEADLARRLDCGDILVREISDGVPVKCFCFVEQAGQLLELAEAWPEEIEARRDGAARGESDSRQ